MTLGAGPSLKDFIRKAAARKLYRSLLRELKGCDPHVRGSMQEYIRAQYAANAHKRGHDVDTLLGLGNSHILELQKVVGQSLGRTSPEDEANACSNPSHDHREDHQH